MSSLFGDLVGQAIGGALSGGAPQGQQAVGLGGMLGSLLGGNQRGNGALLATLLPVAMQYVQANGGIGAVLAKFQGAGHGDAAASWLSTGANQPIGADALTKVLGSDAIAQMAQSSGLPHAQVAGGLAEILPELVNKLSPSGADSSPHKRT